MFSALRASTFAEEMPLYYAIAGSAALVIAIMLALNGELTAVYGEYLTTFIIHAVGLVSVSVVSLVKRENPIKMAKGVWAEL